jgi:O-antigen ligase
MRFRLADISGASAASLVLPTFVLVAAVFAGIITAMVGSMAGYRAVYYVAVFGFIVIGGIVAATRTEPLRFVFLALIACFPIADAIVPPGRLGLTVFHAVMIALTIGLIGKKLFASSKASAPLFPTPSLLSAWLFAVPCVVMSQFPSMSLYAFIGIFAIYTFFLFALNELRRERGFERLVLLWSVVSLILAAGLFVDHLLHVSLTVQGNNLNQLGYAGSLEIYRAGGFFQDPQKGGAFLACMITFLLLLSVRGRFRGMKMRFVVWAAIAVGSMALITTISRSAILACLLVSGLALFAFNKWNAAAKLALMGTMVLLVIVMALMPIETWRTIVPATITERFVTLGEDFEIRRKIWFDTWNMFADHPLAGIGLGSFQPFLIETRQTVFNFYGIGAERGVAYVPDQPESGYFKILYEGGISGSIAALLVAGDALRRAALIIAGSDSKSDARTEGIAALAALITFGLTFVTLFTVGDPRIAAILAFLLAVIWHRSLSARAMVHGRSSGSRC